jgi:hypothetical protein
MLALAALLLNPPSSFYGMVFDQRFFVGWGTLALINAGLAQGKGRGGLIWFLWALLFGPFATFILVLLPRGSRK